MSNNPSLYEKKTVRFFKGETDELSAMFPKIGYNKVVRQLVHNLIKTVNEKVNQKQNLSVPDLTPSEVANILREAENDRSDD